MDGGPCRLLPWTPLAGGVMLLALVVAVGGDAPLGASATGEEHMPPLS